jgi:hypothetical protein
MIINMNLTEYMGPVVLRIQDYAEAVDAALGAGTIDTPLTTRCQECDEDFSDIDKARAETGHIIVATTSDTVAVVVGCEGYFHINPNLVGIDSPQWQDWTKDLV